eukprot:COSAG05_NODE_715_length_7805_cov_5.098235_5_plen_90_part_00
MGVQHSLASRVASTVVARGMQPRPLASPLPYLNFPDPADLHQGQLTLRHEHYRCHRLLIHRTSVSKLCGSENFFLDDSRIRIYALRCQS